MFLTLPFRLVLVCLLLVSLSAGQVLAQTRQIDSLKRLVKAHLQADTLRVNRLNALSRAIDDSDPAQALGLAEEARQLAQQLAYAPGLAEAYTNLAWHYTTVNDCPRALTYARQAQGQYRALCDRTGQINSLTQQAYIHIALGNYSQSVTFAQQALVLVEPLPDKGKKAYVNLLLGQLHAHLGNYGKARAYAQVGIQWAREVHSQSEVSRGLNILGEIHRMRGEWAATLRYYQQDLGHYQAYSLNKAICEGNIADVSEYLGQYDDAFRYGQRVLACCQHIHATSYVAWIEGILARTYLHTRQPDKAIAYGTRSLTVAERGGLQKIAHEALGVLVPAYIGRGDYASAYRHQTRYMALKDSLSGAETIRRAAAMQHTFELNKQQSQISLLTQKQTIEQERNRYQRRLLYASLFIGLLLLTLTVVLIRSNQAKNQANAQLQAQKQIIETTLTDELLLQRQHLLESQLQTQREELRVAQAQLRLKDEKERIARDLHDHVGAQLSVIAANANGTATVGPNGVHIGEYAREAIQSLRDTVWAIDQPEMTMGNFRARLQQYLNRQQQLHPACTYILSADAQADQLLSSAQALNLFRQVQEAVHNAFKHAQASCVRVYCQIIANKLTISIVDNGSGFDATRLPTDQPQYGLRNLHRRAEELQGTCHIDTAQGGGTRIEVTIPLTV